MPFFRKILNWEPVRDGLGSVDQTGRPESPSLGWIEEEYVIRTARAEHVNCHLVAGMFAEEGAVIGVPAMEVEGSVLCDCSCWAVDHRGKHQHASRVPLLRQS
eukprot:GFKZ01001407.1.p1 GENE.GFKZ01001407.1~~GFKZ01001407.1.p1  ORF type:complete len:103 (+),score=6.68 GFKZ01001407.1:90-398(+)